MKVIEEDMMARIVAAEVEDVMGIEMVIIGAMEVNIMMARRIGAIEKVADEGNQEIRVVSYYNDKGAC